MLLYDPEMSTFQFDGHRMDLAAEYRDNLRGPFSLDLQQILDRMRTTPMKGRFALVVVEPFKKFALARLSGERGVPPTCVDGVFYQSVAEAEWDIFKRRWKELTGVDVTVGDPSE